MVRLLDHPCLETMDESTKELNRVRQAERDKHGHNKKHKNCPMCQIADGPAVRHDSAAREDPSNHDIYMVLSGPREIADNHEGKAVAYAVFVVVRLQDANHRRSFLPWVKAIQTNAQGEVLEATEDENSAIPLTGSLFENRVFCMHTDRGGEWLNATFRQEDTQQNHVGRVRSWDKLLALGGRICLRTGSSQGTEARDQSHSFGNCAVAKASPFQRKG